VALSVTHAQERSGTAASRWKQLLTGTILIFALLAASVLFATDKVEFSIVARVRFAVPGDWKVISSKSDAEVTVFAFRMPNPADEGTPDSTNLAFIASYLKDQAAKSAFDKKASHREPNASDRRLVDKWSCTSFSGNQEATSYEVWDCYRIVAKCGVHVRMAWPHLPKNPPDYDKSMEAALKDVLESVAPTPNVPSVNTEQPHP
jgi:hypothetical protein